MYSALRAMAGCPSGQWERTVNPSANAYTGSNPVPATTAQGPFWSLASLLSTPELSSVRLVGIQMVEQALHGGAHLGEGSHADDGRPLLFDRGYAVAGMGHQRTSP